MTPLLARQLRKHLPDIDPTAPAWRDFLNAVDRAYEEAAQEHAFLEHTLEVASAELTEANERLRRDAENQLASLSRYYLQTLELQHGMILCVRRTPQGFEHTLVRGQLLTRIGLTPADIEGRLIEEVAPPPQAAELNAAYARAWAGENCAFTFTTSDGIELFVAMRLRDTGSAVQEVIASCIEITALKQAERELRAAKERAEAADRAKSEFLAVMSHEIRTPLNAVLGFSALLQQSSINAEQQSWLHIINDSGESLLALINDILDFSKIEAGRFPLHLEPVQLPALLNQVANLFRPRAHAKGLTFDLACELPASPAILSDPHRLKQILTNLVANAVKFTQHGSIRVTARIDPPDADSATAGRKLRFAIHDTGIGIPSDRRDRLFKPFSQVDSSTTRTYGGTGLGLAICDRLVRLLGGEISVESEFGRGSTFSFWIRAALASDHPDIAAAPPRAAHESPRAREN